MITIQEINRAIVSGQFTNDELVTIGDAIRFARSQLTKQNRRSLVIGTRVKFTNSRNGQVVVGTIEKMALKFATVNSGVTRWKVPASMLEMV